MRRIRQKRQAKLLAASHMGFYVRHLATEVNRCRAKSCQLLLKSTLSALCSRESRGASGRNRENSGKYGPQLRSPGPLKLHSGMAP